MRLLHGIGFGIALALAGCGGGTSGGDAAVVVRDLAMTANPDVAMGGGNPDIATGSNPDIAIGAGPDIAMAGPQTHPVTVGMGGALSFTPATLTINAGDTVHWVWASSFHNVTSGTNGTPDNKFCSPNNMNCGPTTSNAGAT